jgi:DNA-binding LacI/PurR family transcriptional regulator
MSDSPNIPLDSGASPARPVTLHDLAQVLGISYVTVSLALRDRGRISEGLRARIKQTAKEMNYRADPMALALVQYRSRKPSSSIHSALAWINLWKDPKKLRSYREFDLYWQGAYATADAAGYRLEEFSIDEKLSLARLKTILHTRRIGGIILPPQEQPVDWNGFD